MFEAYLKWRCPLKSCSDVVVGIGPASLVYMKERHCKWHKLRGETVDINAPSVTLDDATEGRDKLYGRLILTPDDIKYLIKLGIAFSDC